MSPGLIVDFPDPGVLLIPALCYRGCGDLGCLPSAGVQPVMPGSGGEKQQALAERVELELPVDPVPDEIESAGISGQVQPALVGYPAAGDGISRQQPRPVGMEPIRHEAHSLI